MIGLPVAFRIVLAPWTATAESTLCKRGGLGIGDGGSVGSGESKCELCEEPGDGEQSSNGERELHC